MLSRILDYINERVFLVVARFEEVLPIIQVPLFLVLLGGVIALGVWSGALSKGHPRCTTAASREGLHNWGRGCDIFSGRGSVNGRVRELCLRCVRKAEGNQRAVVAGVGGLFSGADA